MLESIIDIAFSLALFVNAILFIPQIIRLARIKDSQGLSIITFLGFTISQLITIFHGYFHHDNILIYGFLLSLITCGTVTVMIIFYRK